MKTLSVTDLKNMGACNIPARVTYVERHLGRKVSEAEALPIEAWIETTGSIYDLCWFLERIDRGAIEEFVRWCDARSGETDSTAFYVDAAASAERAAWLATVAAAHRGISGRGMDWGAAWDAARDAEVEAQREELRALIIAAPERH